jgi:hypothetical protein
MPDVPPLDDKQRSDLIAYLDGELDEQSARELEAQLSKSPKARAEAEALRRTWDLLDYLPKPEPSANFTHRTLDRIAPPPTMLAPRFAAHGKSWALGVGWAAAVLLAAVGGYAGMRLLPHRSPTPPAAPTQDIDPQMVRDVRVLDDLPRYQHAEDLRFLKELDDPDLFGDDSGG